jgi:predicted ATP-grasp superfamily ATP-dependent carboligase
LDGGLAAAAPRSPAVIKPAVKASRNALTHDKAWRVDDAAELATRWAEACRLVDPELLMVQELIDGSEQLSFAALCRDGEVLASLTARRRRQHPGDFGRASTYVETIDDASLERDASALLRAMGYTGIVEVEYKRDPSTGANLLLDVNPRAWGWQSLGAHAGVDFPLLLWRMALGEDVPRARARAGERWIRLLTDVPAAWEQHRRGRLSVADWLRSLRGPLAGAVFAPDDPLPALTDVALLATVAARRALRPGTC